MEMNPLVELQKYGQSFWLDNITRRLITSGELKRLVEEDGLRPLVIITVQDQHADTAFGDRKSRRTCTTTPGLGVPGNCGAAIRATSARRRELPE